MVTLKHSLFQIFAAILSVAAAIPVEDTPEVAAAKAEFMKAFAAAEAGQHASLAPAPVASAYLADEPEVADAKAAFMKTFAAYEAGEIPLPEAPAAPVVAAPVVSYAAPYYYNNYYNWAGAYPYAYGGYPYAYGAYPYLGYGLPTVVAAKAE